MTSSTEEGQAKTSVEASLNLGEVIAGDMDNTVNRFLARDHDPNLTTAASTDLFYERLQIDHQIAIVSDVLTNFVNHEQKTEVLTLAVNILLNICDELCDAQFVSSSPLNQFRAACSLIPEQTA